MKKEHLSPLDFKSTEHDLSIGAELELQVLDSDSLLLSPRAAEIIELSDDKKIVPEFFQSTIEVVSRPCLNVHELKDDLKPTVFKAAGKANQLSLKLCSTGTHPLADYRERLITPSKRYHSLIDRNQWLIRRMAVYGMHIHVGMTSGETCIKYNYFFLHLLPHILALSGSSPFWQGMYTGLASCRPTTYEAMPSAGMPYLVKDWADFQKLHSFLIKSKAISSTKDLWWDIRPSPHNGTVELRFSDEPATLKECLAIVAFVHLLAHWFRDHEEEWSQSHTPLKHWIFRENKWRAIRYGLHANVVATRTGKTKLLYKDIQEWVKAVAPYTKKLQYEEYMNDILEIIEKGTSSERQYRVFEQKRDLREVIRHNVMEFEKGEPIWAAGNG